MLTTIAELQEASLQDYGSGDMRSACCLQAIKLMKSQQDGGHIFLMDGAGADGSATPRFAAYGASKRGLAQLRKSLQVS